MAPPEERTRWQSQRRPRPGNAANATTIAERGYISQAASADRDDIKYVTWEFQDYDVWWTSMAFSMQTALEFAWRTGLHRARMPVPEEIEITEDKYEWDLVNMTQTRLRGEREEKVRVRNIRRVSISNRVRERSRSEAAGRIVGPWSD